MCRIKLNCYLQPVTKLHTVQQSNSNHKLYNICEVHNMTLVLLPSGTNAAVMVTYCYKC